jgi:DNA-binding transcriptional LysR family regulator
VLTPPSFLDGALPPGIELRLLRYFLAVAHERHFGRAAALLGITQPPLSNAIKQLESELGVELFTRTSRSVALTEAGVVLAHEATGALVSCANAVRECRRAAAGAELRLGCPPDLPLQRTQAFLGGMYGHDPESRIEVTHVRSPEQLRRLRAGELDIGVIHSERNDDAIEMEPLFRGEPLAALLPVGHRLAPNHGISPDELRGEVLVIFPRVEDPPFHDRLLAAIQTPGTGSGRCARRWAPTPATRCWPSPRVTEPPSLPSPRSRRWPRRAR